MKTITEEEVNNPGTQLITTESNPDLIKAVTEELRATEAHLILTKLQDIEKAIYHLAGRQQELVEKQTELTEVVVYIATTLEEMLNGMEVVPGSADSEEEEEEMLESAWDGRKVSSPLN